MQANLLPSPPHHTPFNSSSLLSIKKPFHLRPTTTFTMHATDGETKSTTTNITEKDDDKKQSQKPVNTLNIRYRSKRRAAKEQQQQQMPVSKPKPPPKDWESMSLAEKAMELYVGEKGLLFWLNKFAYASIFIIIGGWIVFRFVGPSLGFYELDAPPLSPTSILKG